MSTHTNAREVGEGLDLMKCNAKFYEKIEAQFEYYNKSKSAEADDIHELLTAQHEAAELSDDELNDIIREIEDRIEAINEELSRIALSDDIKDVQRRLELFAELKENRNRLVIYNSELEIRRTVDEEIRAKKETLVPANSPENRKRISELEKSREKRLERARDEVYNSLKQDINRNYWEYRTALLADIAEVAKQQVRFIKYLFDNGKMTDKEEIYKAINELLTRKLDDEVLDETIFKAVYEELSLHSDLFIIWNSYEQLKEHKINGVTGTTPTGVAPTGTTPTGTTPTGPTQTGPTVIRVVTKPDKTQRPDLTMKTALAITMGIGLGTGVFFAFGGAGVAVLSIAGVVAKAVLNKKRQELIEKSYLDQNNITYVDPKTGLPVPPPTDPNTVVLPTGSNDPNAPAPQVQVQSTEEPTKGLKGAIKKFRKYISSEEGIRDLLAFFSAAVISGNVLNFANILTGGLLRPFPCTFANTGNTNNPGTGNNVAGGTQPTADSVVIGDQVGSHNVSTGYDTAAYSVTRSNAESLIPQHINGTDSVFKEFAIMDSTGQSVLQRVSTNGLTATQASQQFGVPLEQIAVNVGRAADGADQAWISVNELIGQAGKIK